MNIIIMIMNYEIYDLMDTRKYNSKHSKSKRLETGANEKLTGEHGKLNYTCTSSMT